MLLNKPIPVSYVLNKIKYNILYVLIVSIAVLWITEEFTHLLPEMPLTIPAFIGTAISILLSFKLNQSYDRWWEARKIWGAIVNDSRSLVVQLQSLVAKDNTAIIQKIAYRQIAWCYCLGQSLRKQDPLANMDQWMNSEEIEHIKKQQNKALALLQLHAFDLKQLRDTAQIDAFAQIQIDNTLVRLCAAQGKSERIKSTVFPVTYRIFLQAIIYLFVVTLSIALKDVAGLFEIPLLLIISSAFFLLEKSATHMQDPFENRATDTPVSSIAKTIEINIKQLLMEKDIPNPMPTESFYVL
jgi:putative membrane protein